MCNEPRDRDQTYNALYINLLAAYLSLVQMRDYMRFLAKVTEPREGDCSDLLTKPEELVWCFTSFATDLNGVVQTIQWSIDASAQAHTGCDN